LCIGAHWRLKLVVCRRVHVLFTLFVSVCVQWCPTHILSCLCFVFLRLVYLMLSVSLHCPFLIAPFDVFVCFVCLRVESCVPNVARFFSGMSIILISPSVFSNVYCKCHYFNMSILTNNMCDLICIDLIRFLCLTPLSAIFQPYHGDQF
jgi:hypothetical protein